MEVFKTCAKAPTFTVLLLLMTLVWWRIIKHDDGYMG